MMVGFNRAPGRLTSRTCEIQPDPGARFSNHDQLEVKMIEKECAQCGEMFAVQMPYEAKRRKFCSLQCNGEARRVVPEDRFWDYVPRGDPDEFWEWSGGTTSRGYGAFGVYGRMTSAHRYAWTIANGEIPDGLMVRHKCDNPPCVNINHLELGTAADNMRDKKERGGQPQGEEIHQSKLTAKQVIQIRDFYASGARVQTQLADDFRVSQALISDIVRRKWWKHI